jgi:hypothetical protein
MFYGTQNEFIDFQVHVHDVGGGTAGLNLMVGDFVQSSPNKYTISSSTSSVPFNVVVYREAYLNIKNVTASSATFYGSTGHYPDILIPAVDPYYRQSTNAFPFTISPGNNQSVWIDVHIPSAAPPGYYRGTVTLQKQCPRMCTTIATLQIIIGVWQWPSAGSMPSTSSLPSYEASGTNDMCIQYFGGYNSCGSFPGATRPDDGVSLTQQQLAVLMLDHRRSFTTTYPPVSRNFTTWESYFKSLLDGTNPSSLSLMLSGAKTQIIRFNGLTGNQNPDIQSWITEFHSNGWQTSVNPIFYPVDEPGATCSNWAAFEDTATIVHGDTPPGQTFVTADISDANTCNTTNSIDIFVVLINAMDVQGGSLQRSSYNTWLSGASNRHLWSYQSCSSSGTCGNGSIGGSTVTYPNVDVDGVPVANRAFEWMTFLHNQTGELYYDDAFCWSQNCGYPTTTTDPWSSVYAFGGNGDGTMVYPSTGYNGTSNVNHITQSGGSALITPIVVPSIRLKLVRDGMQDYEYLNELTKLGYGTLVRNQVASWIRNSYTFETTGSGLQAARMDLGIAMHQLSYPTNPPIGAIENLR